MDGDGSTARRTERPAVSVKMMSDVLGTDELQSHIRSLSDLVTASAENVRDAVLVTGKEKLKVKRKVQTAAHIVRDTTHLAILYLDCLTDFADHGRAVERARGIKEAIMKRDMSSFNRYLSDLQRLLERTAEAREAFIERYKEADSECSGAQATCSEAATMRRGDKIRCRLTGAATIGLGFAIGALGLHTSRIVTEIGGAAIVVVGIFTIVEGELVHAISQKKLSQIANDLFSVVEAVNSLHESISVIQRLGERARGAVEDLEAKSSQQSSGIDVEYLSELCAAVSMLQDRCCDIHCTVSDASNRATEALDRTKPALNFKMQR